MSPSPGDASPSSPAPTELEQRLGYAFSDPALLEQALTHASCKGPGQPSNERFEFLGDAVLGMVVAHFLFWAYPELEEGPLTRLRSAVVSTSALARYARRLGLDRAARVGRGLQRKTLSDSVLANVVEGVFGAIFLDGGLPAARAVILWGLAEAIEDELAQRSKRNWKSQLQELTQQALRVTPTYEVLSESGPDHRKQFLVAALVNGQRRGRGGGASKKIAEQAAAREAYLALVDDPLPRRPGRRKRGKA